MIRVIGTDARDVVGKVLAIKKALECSRC
jgi:predicted fused transcriptional regulator/phosphomethylpyrimidine kinase